MSEFNAGILKGGIELDTDKFAAGMKRAVATAVSGSAQLTDALGRPFAPAAAEMQKVDYASKNLGESMREVTAETKSTSSALAMIASTAAGTAIGNLASSLAGSFRGLAGTFQDTLYRSLSLSAGFESTALAMRTMIGDAKLADELLKNLKTFAGTTPFQFAELANASKLLLAMGVDAGNVVDTLRMIGDVSSGLNQPIGEMAFLFGQIKSQGRAMTEDMNQFAGRGVPVAETLAKLLNVSRDEVKALASEGQIGFAQIEAAFRAMTSEGGRFFRMTATQAETSAGLFSTLGDSIEEVQKQVGDALISGANGKQFLKDVTAEIERLKPAAVEVGVGLSQAFTACLPAIRETIEYLKVVLEKLGLIDSGFDPFKGASQNREAIDHAINDQKSFGNLSQIQSGAAQAINEAAGRYKGKGNGDENDANTQLELLTGDAAKLMQQTTAAFAELQAKQDRGGKLSDDDFKKAKDEAILSLFYVEEVQRTIGTLISKMDPTKDGESVRQAAAVAATLRRMTGGAQKALRDLMRDSAAAEAKAKAQQESNEAYRLMTEGGGPGEAASATPPTGRASAGSVGRSSRDAAVAALRSDGKREEAELLKALHDLNAEKAAIVKAYESGSMRNDDATNARLLAESNYQREVQAIRDRYAKERANKAEQDARRQDEVKERIDTHRTNAQAAMLEDIGKTAEAQLLKFDNDWERRIKRIKDAGERAAAEAERDAERAKLTTAAGSASAETPAALPWDSAWRAARGTLNDTPKPAGPAGQPTDLIYRPSLGDAGGRPTDLIFRGGGVGAITLPNFPTPLDGADNAMRIPAVGGGNASPVTPHYQIQPQFNVDEKVLSRLVINAVQPIIDEKLERMETAARVRDYVANVRDGA